jgi:putative long chain acyl-CoA synthase
VDHKDTVATTPHGPVFAQPILDILNDLAPVDTEVAFGVDVGGRTLAVAVVSLRAGYELNVEDLSRRLSVLPAEQRPDLVYVAADIPVSASFRPSVRAVRAAGLPEPGGLAWYHDEGHYLPLDAATAARLYGTG